MARGCSAGSSSCFRSQSQTTEGGLICCHLAFITLAKRLLRSQVSERRVPPGRNKARIVMGVAMGSIKCSITWSAITTSTDASAQIETRNVVDDLEPKAILHFAAPCSWRLPHGGPLQPSCRASSRRKPAPQPTSTRVPAARRHVHGGKMVTPDVATMDFLIAQVIDLPAR